MFRGTLHRRRVLFGRVSNPLSSIPSKVLLYERAEAKPSTANADDANARVQPTSNNCPQGRNRRLSAGGSARQVSSVFTRESTNANNACCPSLTPRISRITRSRLTAIRSSAASTPLSRPASSRWIAARIKALGFEEPPCLVANAIRLSSSGSSRAARVRSFRLSIFVLLNGKAGQAEAVTESSTIVQQSVRRVEHRNAWPASRSSATTRNLFNNPLCSTTRLCCGIRPYCGHGHENYRR